MKETIHSKVNSLLKLEYQKGEDNIWLTNSYSLRKLIGVFGMAMPLLLFVFLYLDTGYKQPLPSISHYYFTRVAGIFIIIVSSLAIFLIVYKGKKPIDFYISVVSGIFALLLVLFPTGNLANICGDLTQEYAVTILKENGFREIFHYVSAGIFLLGLAIMSIFIFTKSDKKPEERGIKKILRNRIYRICGGLMILAIFVIFAGFLKIIPQDFYECHELTFWMETLAVESFGFSWLIKGETLFKD